MDIKKSSHEERDPASIAKKPYEKPGFRYEHVFVTSALSCGKMNAITSQCTTLSAS